MNNKLNKPTIHKSGVLKPTFISSLEEKQTNAKSFNLGKDKKKSIHDAENAENSNVKQNDYDHLDI